jgi:predicted Zn-dependent peptidase
MKRLVDLRLATAVIALALGCAFSLNADADAAAATPWVKVPDYTRFVLPNGLTVILVPKKDVPLIAFSGFVRGGALADPAVKPGVAALVAGLLDRGAGKRNAYEFADAVEGVGGTFNAGAGAEAVSVNGQFLARDRALMIELLADALMRPHFDAAEFKSYRDRDIEFIKSAKDSDPSQLLGIYGRAALFARHPYGRPQSGSERTLAAITQGDVVSYHAAHFGADRATLVFAGDLDAKWMKQALTAAFSGWAKAKAAPLQLKPAPRVTGRRVLLIDSPGAVQTYFWLGNVGVDRRYSGRPALDLVNTLYGGRFTSILNTELRIKSGLSYGANSSFVRGSVPGEFSIRSFTQTATTGEMNRGVAQAATAQDPRLLSAFHDSFMAAMSTACVVVGLLCLVGAVGAALLLPGRIPAQVEVDDEPVAAPAAA